MIMDFAQHAAHGIAPRPSGSHFALSAERWEQHERQFDQYMQKHFPDAWIQDSDESNGYAFWIHAVTGNCLVRVVAEGTGSQCSDPSDDGVMYMILDEQDLLDLAEITFDVLTEAGTH